MAFGDRDHDGSQQDDFPEGGSSSQSNDSPAYPMPHPYDRSLAGSSSHVPQPQGSVQTTFSTNNPTHPPYSEYTIPRSGQTPFYQSSNVSQANYSQFLANDQVSNTLTTAGTVQPNGWQQCMQEGIFPVNGSPSSAPSPFYRVDTQNDTAIQPVRHQQQYIQYSDGRRASLTHLNFHSPVPQEATGYLSALSPTRSESFSPSEAGSAHPEPSLQRVSFPRPRVPSDRSSRSGSNPAPVTRPNSNPQSLPQIYDPFFPPSNNPSQPPILAPYSQPPWNVGGMSPTGYIRTSPPSSGPSFPEPQHLAQPTRPKRKRETQTSPSPQPNRPKRKRGLPAEEQPVASSSRVTLDTPSDPRKALDAERKRKDRSKQSHWLRQVDGLLTGPNERLKAKLRILDGVIKHFGGDAVPDGDGPCNPKRKNSYHPKGKKNSIRAKNEGDKYTQIRGLLRGMDYKVPDNTGRPQVLHIVVYVLLRWASMNVDEDLYELVRKFLPQDNPGPPGP